MTTALDLSFFEFFEFWIWTNHNSLLSIATNQFASFFIDIRSRQCYFRVCQSGEIWNKNAFFPRILIFLLYKTNRFHVAVRLFSNRSQRTSKCGKNISDTLGCASCATFLFLPHFDVLCDLLLNRRTATWNLFVKHILWNIQTRDLLKPLILKHAWKLCLTLPPSSPKRMRLLQLRNYFKTPLKINVDFVDSFAKV